jgi:hypothetical protein
LLKRALLECQQCEAEEALLLLLLSLLSPVAHRFSTAFCFTISASVVLLQLRHRFFVGAQLLEQ